MNHAMYDAFMRRVHAHPHPCKHGHPECSDEDGGPCCDEEYPARTCNCENCRDERDEKTYEVRERYADELPERDFYEGDSPDY